MGTTGKLHHEGFPAWAYHLNWKEAVIRGIDIPPHADPESYREAVSFIAIPTAGPAFEEISAIAIRAAKG